MTYMLVSKQGIFRKVEFDNEKELENVVIENYKLLFGGRNL